MDTAPRSRGSKAVVFTSWRKTALVVGVVSWIVFVTVLILLDEQSSTVEVAVAQRAIAVGERVNELVEPLEIDADSPLVGTLLAYDVVVRPTPMVAVRPIAAGQAIAVDDVARR